MPCAAARGSVRGLSLVEMLVAMAIFIVLLAGVSLLFSGAIDAVRSGYVNQEAFERARSSMTVLERDLSSAFTAREFGDYYAFYGGPRGFSFVGVIDTGALARVTYVAHPTADAIRYESSYAEKYGVLYERAKYQGGMQLVARFVAMVLPDLQVAFPGLSHADAVNPKPDPDDATTWNLPLLDYMLEFDPVVVETQSIVRFVETGRNDLNTFEVMRPDGSRLAWPVLSRFEPADDTFNANDPDNLRLYLMMLDGLNPRILEYDTLPLDNESLPGILGGVNDTTDLRVVMQQYYPQLRAFSSDHVDGIIQAKRRELWLRMLAGEPGLPQFWGNINDPADPRPKAEHYVLAENILYRMYDPRLSDFDLSGSPPLFTYWIAVDKEPKPAYFNDVRLIPFYTDFVARVTANPSSAQVLDALLLMDQGVNGTGGLVSVFASRTPSLAVEGMPLAPRLPAFIGAGFWVATPSRWVNSKDFLRWFAAEVNVPAAAGRDMQSVLMRREQL